MPDETNTHGQDNCPQTSPELEALYLEHFPTIKASIHEAFPGLNFLEADAILVRLSQRLHRFNYDSVSDFLRLASQYVRNYARHQSLYLSLVTDRENAKAIRSAIRRTVHADYEDCAVEPSEDIFSEIYSYLYTHCNGFLSKKQDTAKISTRLYALAARHCEFYHNAYRYRRFNIVAENVTTLGLGGAEFLSEVELDSIRADEGEDDEAA